jgi:hypothetical protein
VRHKATDEDYCLRTFAALRNGWSMIPKGRFRKIALQQKDRAEVTIQGKVIPL